METTEITTTNLCLLRKLRQEEKSIKSQIAAILPLAREEAKLIQPEGGKFSVIGVGEFVLDVNPILEKNPDNPNDTAPDIFTSRDANAVQYRKHLREQNGYKAQASALTKTVKGFYEAFKTKYGHLATRKDYTLKCLGLD